MEKNKERDRGKLLPFSVIQSGNAKVTLGRGLKEVREEAKQILG